MHSAAPWSLALLLAGTIAIAAYRARSLSLNGALAALAVGTLALRAGWSWGVFLIAWFALATILSRIGRIKKAGRTGDIVAKGDRRDARQVLANGGVFACCAALSAWSSPSATLAIAAAGALTAAGADTWATEIGTLYGGQPWSVRTWTRVAAGTSGAVTVVGVAGSVLAAIVLSGLASVLGLTKSSAIAAVALGGLAGSAVDTLVGAWMQERRWCPRCAQLTERLIHTCNTPTVHSGGWNRLDNDAVNALCTVAGSCAAVVIAEFGSRTW
jgi:uncharacterized protein (TIGR00297 family)